MSKPKPRIGIVYPGSNLDSIPSLYNTAVCCAQAGYAVDILTRLSDRRIAPEFDSTDIICFPIEGLTHAKRKGVQRLVPGRYHAELWTRWRHTSARYRCLIGVDPAGLIEAARLAKKVGVPYAYYSLELLLSYEIESEAERALKAQERILARGAEFVVIQDADRAALLIQDTGIDPQRVVYVPNAPLGPAAVRRSNYLRERFQIPAHRKIILHAGSLRGFACVNELAASARDWPDDWVMVCHTRYRVEETDYLEALKLLAGEERILFSTDPLPAREYAKVISSADAGLAMYCPRPHSVMTGDNIRHIGLSSGKFAYYLWSGVPVVVNETEPLHTLVDRYHCGARATDPRATRDAIATVLADGETMRENAVRCFNERLDFVKGFAQVLERLNSPA